MQGYYDDIVKKYGANSERARKIHSYLRKHFRYKGTKRFGETDSGMLGGIFLIECEAMCAFNYDDMLDQAVDRYESCRDAAFSKHPSLQAEAHALCDDIFELDLVEGGATYLACGLTCLCPFSWFK